MEAERLHIRNLLDGAVRSGHDVAVVDLGSVPGEAFAAAAPALPGPIFNTGNGIVNGDQLDAARAHWEAHGTTGWIQSLTPPWPGAVPTDHLAISFARPGDVPEHTAADDIVLRLAESGEARRWADVDPGRVADATGGRPRLARRRCGHRAG